MRCRDAACKACHLFLPSCGKYFHELCVTCREQQFSNDVRCDHCKSWSLEEWARVQTYKDRVASEREGRRERKVYLLSLVFRGFCYLILIYLLQMLLPISQGLVDVNHMRRVSMMMMMIFSTPFMTDYIVLC